jgi:hypothetical protein
MCYALGPWSLRAWDEPCGLDVVLCEKLEEARNADFSREHPLPGERKNQPPRFAGQAG